MHGRDHCSAVIILFRGIPIDATIMVFLNHLPKQQI